MTQAMIDQEAFGPYMDKIGALTDERDRARRVAVALEQELAEIRALQDAPGPVPRTGQHRKGWSDALKVANDPDMRRRWLDR